ncbi:MAG: hypothetical protein KAX49_11720 [Halanaerobiales bacterium]|nr:hypothetical protein [Halanaerobiales bacterium]
MIEVAEPNFNLLLWVIFIIFGISSLVSVIAGILGAERPERYGITDILAGLLMMLVFFVVLIF